MFLKQRNRFLPIFLAATSMSLLAGGCKRTDELQGKKLSATGYELLQRGQASEAFPYCERAVRLAPNDAEVRKNYGLALADTGQYDQAISQLNMAVQMRPNFDKAYNNLGKALWGKGQYDEAIAAYQKAIAITPDYVKAHQNLAAALRDRKRTDEAITEYKKAIELDPQFIIAYEQLARLLCTEARIPEAQEVIQAGLSVADNDADLHRLYGVTYREQGQWDQAIQEWEAAVRLMPDLYMAWENLVEGYKHQHRNDDAEEARRHIKELSETVAADHARQAVLHLRRNEYEDCIKESKESIRVFPGDQLVYVMLGQAYEKVYKMQEAEKAYRDCLKVDPTSAAGHSRLGAILYQSGNRAAGRAEWTKMLELSAPEEVAEGKQLLAEFP